jgi:hypothetical protein
LVRAAVQVTVAVAEVRLFFCVVFIMYSDLFSNRSGFIITPHIKWIQFFVRRLLYQLFGNLYSTILTNYAVSDQKGDGSSFNVAIVLLGLFDSANIAIATSERLIVSSILL